MLLAFPMFYYYDELAHKEHLMRTFEIKHSYITEVPAPLAQKKSIGRRQSPPLQTLSAQHVQHAQSLG